MLASVDSVETFGLVDGPGIRFVVFFTGCNLRCKYCHNPEMQIKGKDNMDVDTLFNKILRCSPYFGDDGGVTFSGGEPLLHSKFIIELCKKLKRENINTCLDTAGDGLGNYDELLKYIDIVLLDIKHTDKDGYKDITGMEMKKIDNFIDACNRNNKRIWIRQVIVPGIMDNEEYIDSLVKYLGKIKGIERVDFLPFHRLGREKYIKMGLKYLYEDKKDMDKDRCDFLYKMFLKKYKNEYNIIL